MKKCQLLCKKHHTDKTIVDTGKKLAKGTHGTISSYRYCKCDACREAANKLSREYRRRKRREAKAKLPLRLEGRAPAL